MRSHARNFFNNHQIDEFLSVRKDRCCPWEYEGISETARDGFCDEKN